MQARTLDDSRSGERLEHDGSHHFAPRGAARRGRGRRMGCQPGARLSNSGFGSKMLDLMPNTKIYREMRPEGLYLRTVSPATFLQNGPEISNSELVESSGPAQ